MQKFIYVSFLCFFFFCSCVKNNVTTQSSERKEILFDSVSCHELKWANGFSIKENSYGYELTTFSNLDSSQVYEKYYLIRDSSLIVPKDGKKIVIPINRVATNSGTNFEFLKLLGVLHTLKATCNPEFIYSSDIREKIKNKEIIPLGMFFELNQESLLMANPDVLFLSDEKDKPKVSVCPFVFNWEWKEETVLGRAEWIKFIAAFYDKLDLADSLFRETETRYLQLKDKVSSVKERPSLFAAGNYGDTWYMTGGKGYMSNLYQDAGANFCLADTMVGTVTCGTEWLISNYSQIEYWFNCGVEELELLDSRLKIMSSYKSGKVYHFRKRSLPYKEAGISDFFESAVAHPDVILSDVISVLHPELLPGYEPVYLGRCISRKEKGVQP